MSHSLKELTEEALQLSPNERVVLAESLLLTIDEAHGQMVDEATMAELERRLDDFRSGRTVGIPVEQVLEELRNRLKQSA